MHVELYIRTFFFMYNSDAQTNFLVRRKPSNRRTYALLNFFFVLFFFLLSDLQRWPLLLRLPLWRRRVRPSWATGTVLTLRLLRSMVSAETYVTYADAHAMTDGKAPADIPLKIGAIPQDTLDKPHRIYVVSVEMPFRDATTGAVLPRSSARVCWPQPRRQRWYGDDGLRTQHARRRRQAARRLWAVLCACMTRMTRLRSSSATLTRCARSGPTRSLPPAPSSTPRASR